MSDALSDALSGGGEGEHPLLSEDDPELVREALPFTLKLLDILIAQDIRSPEILLVASQAYIANAALFLQTRANTVARDDFAARAELLDRAKKHYLRGRNYAIEALAELNEDFDADGEDADFEESLSQFEEEHVPYLYFAAAGWFAAAGLDTFDLGLALTTPRALALMDRAYELDPDYNRGAIDEFYILVYGLLPESLGGDKDKAYIHYQRALSLSENQSASAYLSYAAVTAVPDQDIAAFEELMRHALAIDVYADSNSRLTNLVRQKEAQWYLDNLDQLFIDYDVNNE